jgi:hypothetical protein
VSETAAPAAELVFLSGSFKGRRLPLRDRAVVVGRESSCDVMLDDESASRRHAEISCQNGRLRVKDLGSTNGTYVNDGRAEDAELHNGDRITVAMPDGTFIYRVYKTKIVDASALWVKRRVGFDQLILSACHPLHSAAQRIVVFARYVRRDKPEVKS